MVLFWKRRQQDNTIQEQRSINEPLSEEEHLPFAAVEDSIPINDDFPPRTRPILEQTRLYIHADDENGSLPTLLSPQTVLCMPSSDISSSVTSFADGASLSTHVRHQVQHQVQHHQDYERTMINPQHLRHGISQDNQYIRRGIQETLARNYEQSPAIAVFSDDPNRRLFAGNPNVELHVPTPGLQRQQEEGSEAPFLLENQIDQQREWLEVEFHPKLQSALLDRHRQHRDENFLVEYAEHLKDGNSLSPRIQEFLLEQAKALEQLSQQLPLSNPRVHPVDPSTNHHHHDEDAGQFLSRDDHQDSSTTRRYSSSSISMRIWMGSEASSTTWASDRDISYASVSEPPPAANRASTTSDVSELLLLPPPPRAKARNAAAGDDDEIETDDDMDSRFSDTDYMTDYQWTALRLAILKNNNSSLVGKYKKALQASADLPSQPTPPKRQIPSRSADDDDARAAPPVRRGGGGVSRRMPPNYDSGDDGLEPLVRTFTPPPDGGGVGHPEKEDWQNDYGNKPAPPAIRPKEASVDSSNLLPPQEQIQLAMNEAISNIQTRICQTCQQNILEKVEQNDGAGTNNNKITCSMCGATSCYFCRKTIPASGFDHFNTDPTCLVVAVGSNNNNNNTDNNDGKCPLWTDKQTDLEQDKKLARDMLMEIADQVLQDTFHAKRC